MGIRTCGKGYVPFGRDCTRYGNRGNCEDCVYYGPLRRRFYAKLSFVGNVSDRVMEIEEHVLYGGLRCTYCGPMKAIAPTAAADVAVPYRTIVFKYHGRMEGEYFILEADLEDVFKKAEKYERIKEITR